MTDDTENLWKIYDTNKDWIKFSDSKAVALLGISGVILSIIFSNINKFLTLIQNYIFGMMIIGICCLIFSIVFAMFCLYPRTSKTDKNKKSVVYYKDIAEGFNNYDEFFKKCKKNLNPENMDEILSKQIYEISIVANNKYKRVRTSIFFFGVGTLLLFTSILLIIIFQPDVFNEEIFLKVVNNTI